MNLQMRPVAKPTATYVAAETIANKMREFASESVKRHYNSDTSLQRYGVGGRARCVEDAEYHLEFLVTALHAESVDQFVDYCAWAKILLHSRNIGVSHLIENLKHLGSVLKSKISKREWSVVSKYLQAAITALPDLPTDLPSRIAPERPFADAANAYLAALLHFQRDRASEIVLRESSKGTSVKDIYRYIITPVQQEIGRLWQLGKLTVVHEHYCTAATEIVMSELFRHLVPSRAGREVRILAMCVQGERHCIALRMFADLMTIEGWQVQYIGPDTPTPSAIRFICEEKPSIVAVSVTFPRNIRYLESFVNALKESRSCNHVKILIGGRATSSELCRRIGADAYAECIGDAVEIANRLIA